MSYECEHCGKEILVLRHKFTGNSAPIDADPNENGNLFIKDDLYRIAFAGEIEKAKEIGKPLYRHHSVICEPSKNFGKNEQGNVGVGQPPVCENCCLEMNLIQNDTLWFCPFGCSKIEVK